MWEDLRRAFGISLLLHFLLLWPSPSVPDIDDPLPSLMATLRQPSVPAPAASPVRRMAPSRVEPERHRQAATAPPPPTTIAAPSAAPSTAVALPRSETSLAPAATAAAPAPAAAPAVPPSDGSVEGMRRYRLALAVEARRYKRYPPRALDAGIGGTAEVRIEVADGRATEVTLARPSGDASLDAAALDMIRKAAPRAAVPEALLRRSFAVSLPIVFDPEE